jgi:hypothetical protein
MITKLSKASSRLLLDDLFRERLTIESANILSTALENVYVLFDESVDAIRHCYENGWIHRALARLGTETWYSVGVLPSRLHEK